MATFYLSYAFGTVLFGWLVAAPALWLGRLVRLANPWLLPALVCTLLIAIFSATLEGWLGHGPTAEDGVVGVGLLPAFIWSWGGWFRHRRAASRGDEIE